MEPRTLILTIIVAYLVVCLGIGLWTARRTRTAADFFIAGKRVNVWIFGIAAFSTTMSGFGFVGGPGLVYRYGTSSFWICVPAALGFVVSWLLVSKRLRVFAEVFDLMTLPEAIGVRYGSRACSLAASLVILLGVVGYLGTQILAFGTVAGDFFGLNATTAILCGMAVILVYSVAGGIIASLYTDLFQGAVMIVASIALFSIAMITVGGGSFTAAPGRITDALLASDTPEAIGPWGLAGPMLCLSWFFVFSLGGSGQPHVITKSFMVRHLGSLRPGLLIAAVSYTLCMLLWIGVGFAMKYLVVTGQQPALADPDHAAPRFLLDHTPPWLAGVVFAGLFAAIMSTADAFLNLGAALFVRDIPRALFGRMPENELRAARIATGFVAVAATVFALAGADSLVAVLGIFSWGTFAAALVPAVAIGFNWKRATWPAALAAMTTGAGLHILLEVLRRTPSEEPLYRLPNGVDAGAVSLLASIVVFVVVSFATRARELPARVRDAMDL